MVMENIGKIYYKAYKTLCVYNMRVGYDQEDAPFYSLAIMSMPLGLVLSGLTVYLFPDIMKKEVALNLMYYKNNIPLFHVIGILLCFFSLLVNYGIISKLKNQYELTTIRYNNLTVFTIIMVLIHLLSLGIMLCCLLIIKP
jgi:hypothetical protein